MKHMHSLLKHQIKRRFDNLDAIPPEWQNFIDAVNDAYWRFDADRDMFERTLDLSSQELLQANSELNTIFQAFPDLLYRIDNEGTILDCKAGSTDDLYIPLEQLIGKKIQEVPFDIVGDRLFEAIHQVRESRSMVNIEYPMQIKGKGNYYEARLLPILEDQIIVVVRNITKRKQAEEALQSSLDRFRIVMDSLDAAVYVADMETYELLFLNKYAQANWGDVIGKTCWKVLQSDMTGPCSFCTNEKLVGDNGGPAGVYAWEFQNTMNNEWYDCRDQAIQWVDGRIVRMEIATNITERKRQEETLRKYEHILSSTSDLISFIDRDYVYQAVNEFYLKAHQKEYDEIVGQTVVDLHGPKVFNEVIKKELDRCMAGEEIRYQEWFDYSGIGRRFMDIVYTPYFDASGEASGVVVNIRDITERKLAEEKIRKGRDYLENVLRNSPDAIGIVNEHGRFTEWNSAAEHLIGYSFEEIRGTSFAALYPDKKELDGMLKKLRSDGYIRRYEIDMKNQDGTIIPFETSISLLKDKNNKNIGSVCVARDLSERKRTEEELGKYRDHLEELVSVRTRELKETQNKLVHKERLAALGQVTATVSHELRNPLGTVSTSVFSIGDAIKRNNLERVDRALQLAERNIQRCDGIITELLDFTRKRELKPEPMAIDSWLNDFLDEQDMPEGIEYGRQLRADLVLPIAHEHLRRVVINVITNAVQALQEEESTGNRLTVESIVAGGRLEIRVIDTGPGITADVLDKVFEPLFSTKGFGIGLGLPIVKDIMEEHGGGVEIQSKAGKGTSVVLWLPLKSNNSYDI